MKPIFSLSLLLLTLTTVAQTKKPLTHDVYDGWMSLAEKAVSNNGQWILYSINPQQGDGNLYLQPLTDTTDKIIIPRGYDAQLNTLGTFAIARIKPLYNDVRTARIKKNKPEEMPKDSLALVNLLNKTVEKIATVKSFKIPERSPQWLAYHLDATYKDSAKKAIKKDTVQTLAALADSVIKQSLKNVKGKISQKKVLEVAGKAAKEIEKSAAKDLPGDAEGDEKNTDSKTPGTDLVLRNLATGNIKIFKLVSDYFFDKEGNSLLLKTTKAPKDSNSKPYVIIHHLQNEKNDTILSKFNDAVNFTCDETGSQWAFVAERDSSEKASQKFYKLWYFKNGADSATLLAHKKTRGIRQGYTISEYANLRFSKNGEKLFFGTAPVQPPKDTALVDFETARLDVWHYNDDYIQPQQLKQLRQELRRSYLAVAYPQQNIITQLGYDDAENIIIVDEGNANWVLAQTTKDGRVAASWEGRSKTTAYIIDTKTGNRKLVQSHATTAFRASPKGKFVYWFNPLLKNYFIYNVSSGVITNITKYITQPLYDIENDVPDFAPPMGTPEWLANDESLLVNGFYDIFKVSTTGAFKPVNLTVTGALKKLQFDVVMLDDDKRFFENTDTVLLTAQNRFNKSWSLYTKTLNNNEPPKLMVTVDKSFTNILKAKNANSFLVQQSNIQSSELFSGHTLDHLTQLTNIAQQQQPYIWPTAELVRWKMFDGKMSEGILYKPNNFDPHKKYPVIFYFYERNANKIYSYKAPAPSASVINIPWFVSNGYLVFDPNIYYKKGEPGQSAYNSVVSAAKYLSRFSWIDSARMGLQGQSWGGYQTAYLVTRTNIFKAASAGAPVSNMTSAYGGIRWGSGLVRQFQYEKTQSRIGATLWERPDLYIKNSPLFNAPKINTPLLIMHNDADGAVPWYQGIEMFAALRRLGKKVWLLQYNGEDHNLVERRNRKDLSVRLGQFFDHYLKGAKAPEWMLHGVPAINKGRDWGLQIPD